jgi:hypothetical protein
MFGRMKDWFRIVTRCDRCPQVILPAIPLAATVLVWLSTSMSLEFEYFLV